MSADAEGCPLLKKLTASELVQRYRNWLRHYALDRRGDPEANAWCLLLHLISDFEPPRPSVEVPKRGPGQPEKWTLASDIELVSLITEKINAGLTVAQACEQLIKQEPWRSWSTGVARSRRLSARSLQRRYYQLTRVQPGLKKASNLELFAALATEAPSPLSRKVS